MIQNVCLYVYLEWLCLDKVFQNKKEIIQRDKLFKYTQAVTKSRRIISSLDCVEKFVVNTKRGTTRLKLKVLGTLSIYYHL